MKRVLFFIFTLFFSVHFYAQNYTPTLVLGKVWNMHHYDYFFPSNNYYFDIALDYMQTVNGVTYFHATNGDLLREYLATKKVYKLVDGVEELLLDFDLEIGDDLVSPIVSMIGNTNPIVEIGANSFHGISNLKYYGLDCGEKLIEGIGVQSVGLFGMSSGCDPIDYDEGNSLVDMAFLSIDDYFISNNIKLYYNKEIKSLQLKNASNLIDIQVYSTLGKEVLSIKTNSSMDVSSLEKGIYYYTLSKNHSVKKGSILIY